MKIKAPLITLGVITFLGVAAIFLLLMFQPVYNSGFKGTLDTEGFTILDVIPGSAADKAGLEKGMLITEFNTVDMIELDVLSYESHYRFFSVSTRLFNPAGEYNLVTSAGQFIEFTAGALRPTERLSLQRSFYIVNSIVGAFIVLIGLYFFIRGKRSRPLTAFYLFTLFTAITITLSLFHSYWTFPILVLRYILLDISGTLTAISLFTFIQTFPKVKLFKPLVEFPLLLSPLFIKYLLIAVTPIRLFGPSSYYTHIYTVAMVITIIIFTILQYRDSDRGERRRLRWVFLGVVISIIPYIFFVAYIAATGSYIGSDNITRFIYIAGGFLLLFPLSAGVGIIRYNLFDVDWLLIQLLTFGIGGVLFATITGVLNRFFSITMGVSHFIILILALALVGTVIFRKTHTFLAQRINRHRIEIRRRLEVISDDLISSNSYNEVYAAITEALFSLYTLDFIAFLRLNEGLMITDFIAGNEAAQEEGEKLETEELARILPECGEVKVYKEKLIIPVPRAHSNNNFLILGKRLDHDIYLRDEIEQFSTLSFQIGHALDSSMLYENLNRSLSEKEHLLREIHHRVKNNMQLMSSLLGLQADFSDDPHVTEVLTQCGSRIESMSLIHDALYVADDFQEINMEEYIESVIADTCLSRTHKCSYDIQIGSEVKNLTVKYAMICGILVKELVNNSLLYSLSNNQEGKINIDLSGEQDEQSGIKTCELIILDNGTPIDPRDYELNPATIALQLVKVLSSQIDAQFQFENDRGNLFRFTFQTGHPAPNP